MLIDIPKFKSNLLWVYNRFKDSPIKIFLLATFSFMLMELCFIDMPTSRPYLVVLHVVVYLIQSTFFMFSIHNIFFTETYEEKWATIEARLRKNLTTRSES